MKNILPILLAVWSLCFGLISDSRAMPANDSGFVIREQLETGNFTGNRHQKLFFNQEISLPNENLISGQSFFCDGDYELPGAAPGGVRADALSLGLTTANDDNCARYEFFEGFFKVSAALPVPEPSTLSLVMLGSALLAGSRRRRK